MVFRRESLRGLVTALAAILSHAVVAQTAPPAKRPPVDVRSMVPGAQAPEALSEARAASGLTASQRKDAALQARQEGSLQPAGEAADLRGDKSAAADLRGDKSAPVVAKSRDPAPATASSPLQPQPDAAAGAPPPTLVAEAPPAAPKKRKKARTASAPA